METTGDAVTVTTSAPGGERRLPVDVVVPATGFRPDLEVLRDLHLDVDPGVEAPRRLAPLIDPELHSCGTVPAHGADVLAHPETGFFVVGAKSYGRGHRGRRRRAARPARDGRPLRRSSGRRAGTGFTRRGAGGPRRDRTDNPRIKSPLLCQLS